VLFSDRAGLSPRTRSPANNFSLAMPARCFFRRLKVADGPTKTRLRGSSERRRKAAAPLSRPQLARKIPDNVFLGLTRLARFGPGPLFLESAICSPRFPYSGILPRADSAFKVRPSRGPSDPRNGRREGPANGYARQTKPDGSAVAQIRTRPAHKQDRTRIPCPEPRVGPAPISCRVFFERQIKSLVRCAPAPRNGDKSTGRAVQFRVHEVFWIKLEGTISGRPSPARSERQSEKNQEAPAIKPPALRVTTPRTRSPERRKFVALSEYKLGRGRLVWSTLSRPPLPL